MCSEWPTQAAQLSPWPPGLTWPGLAPWGSAALMPAAPLALLPCCPAAQVPGPLVDKAATSSPSPTFFLYSSSRPAHQISVSAVSISVSILGALPVSVVM